MRKSIIIIALYIIGMAAASIPYAIIQESGIEDTADIMVFISTYSIIFIFMLYFVVTVLKRDFKAFIERFWMNVLYIGIFFVIAFILSVTANIIISLLGITDEAANQGALIDMLKYADQGTLVILVFLFCLVIPIIEELVFRKGLYGLIRGFVQWINKQYVKSLDEKKVYKIASYVAVVLSGLIFGLIHIQGDFIYLLHYGTAGILIGISYYMAKENIYIPLGIHVIQNIFGVVQLLILIQQGII